MKFNDNIKGPDPSYVGAMSVVITGGSSDDRLAVKSVIFNALEGAKFREVDYIKEEVTPEPLGPHQAPTVVVSEPVQHVESLLDAMVEMNPLLFYTSITLESHPSLLASGVAPDEVRLGWKPDVFIDPAPNNAVWERALRPAANEEGKVVEVSFNDGTVVQIRRR